MNSPSRTSPSSGPSDADPEGVRAMDINSPEAARWSALMNLSSRVEVAAGPSRVLDFDLHIALIEDPIWPVTDRRGRVTNPNARMSDYLATYRDVIDADDQDFDFPRYTASLDAALALVERVLPGRAWIVTGPDALLDRPLYGAEIAEAEFSFDTVQAAAPSPALALLTALIRALITDAGQAALALAEPTGRDAPRPTGYVMSPNPFPQPKEA